MFQNIVIAVDLADKDSIKSLLISANALVESFRSKLYFVHIIPDFGTKIVEDYLPKNWLKDQILQYKNHMQDIINEYIAEDTLAEYYVGRGHVYDEVIQYANRVYADLVIVSAVRPQLRDYMLGSNASKIARHCGISVLVVRG
jgi:nucleotide-binding universal stress UspA family protein